MKRPLGQRSLDVLCELLSSEDELSRAASCFELGMRGHEARRAAGKLVLAAGYDHERLVRGAATTALASIAVEGLGQEVLEALLAVELQAEYPAKACLAHAIELVELAIASRSLPG